MITRELLKSAHSTSLLSDVVDFLDSQRRPVKETDRTAGPYPYYGANGLQGWIDGFIFDEPLLLLAEDGGHFDDPDRGVAYRIEGKSWVNNHAHVLRPKPFMDIRFLCRVLENYDLRPFITGSTRAKLTKKDAERIVIPVPPLDEQRRIAAILDQADDLRRKRREALDRLECLEVALFHHLVGDIESNPHSWSKTTLEQITTQITDGEHQTPRRSALGIKLLSARNVQMGHIDTSDVDFVDQIEFDRISKRCAPMRDDLLLSCSGSIGRAAVVDIDEPLCLVRSVALIRPDFRYISSIYLERYLRTPFMQSKMNQAANASGQPNLFQGPIKKLPILIPPLSIQDQVVSSILKVRGIRNRSCAHLARLDALFASLQHRAFRGDLSVPPFSRSREKVAS